MTDADQDFQHSHGTALVTPAMSLSLRPSVRRHLRIVKVCVKVITHLYASYLDWQVQEENKQENRQEAKKRQPEINI